MRIGIDGRYVQDHFPGIGRYTYNLIKGLSSVTAEVDFVVFHNRRVLNTRYDLEGLGRSANIEVVPVDAPTLSLAEQYRLPLLARRCALDLLHSPYFIKPYWLSCHSVVTFYDVIPLLYPQYLPSWWAKPLYRLAAGMALRSSERVIAVSQSACDDLQTFLSVSRQKLAVIPLAVDARFEPLGEESVDNLRHRYGLPAEYALYVGINKPHKNLVHLLEVFSELDGEANLVLAGREDPRYPQARQAAERLGLAKRALFLGDVPDDDLPALYNGAAVFVFPSLYEGFGLPVLEAMACGTPVVCSNTSSLPELVGDAAITLHPQDRGAWVTALEEVLRRGDLRDEMRSKGLQRAKMFSWEETARQTWEVYRDAVR